MNSSHDSFDGVTNVFMTLSISFKDLKASLAIDYGHPIQDHHLLPAFDFIKHVLYSWEQPSRYPPALFSTTTFELFEAYVTNLARFKKVTEDFTGYLVY
jgi:hypothetical protein